MNINKSTLLNWLYSVDKEVPIEELGQWITAKTNGEYTLIRIKDPNLITNSD